MKRSRTREKTIGKCLLCGTEFVRKHVDSRFCCLKCYRKHYQLTHPDVFRRISKRYRLRHPRIASASVCAVCGKEFVRRSSAQKYCSAECLEVGKRSWKTGRPKRKRRQRVSPPTAPKPRTCVVCGKEFAPRRRGSTCCSYRCYRKKYKRVLGFLALLTDGEREAVLSGTERGGFGSRNDSILSIAVKSSDAMREMVKSRVGEPMIPKKAYSAVLGPSVVGVCPVCGAEFVRIPSIKKYCSKTCCDRAYRNTDGYRAYRSIYLAGVIDRMETDPEFYARWREMKRESARKRNDPHRKRPYVPHLSYRIPDEYAKGADLLDRGSSFILGNASANMAAANEAFASEKGRENRKYLTDHNIV